MYFSFNVRGKNIRVSNSLPYGSSSCGHNLYFDKSTQTISLYIYGDASAYKYYNGDGTLSNIDSVALYYNNNGTIHVIGDVKIYYNNDGTVYYVNDCGVYYNYDGTVYCLADEKFYY